MRLFFPSFSLRHFPLDWVSPPIYRKFLIGTRGNIWSICLDFFPGHSKLVQSFRHSCRAQMAYDYMAYVYMGWVFIFVLGLFPSLPPAIAATGDFTPGTLSIGLRDLRTALRVAGDSAVVATYIQRNLKHQITKATITRHPKDILVDRTGVGKREPVNKPHFR